MTTIQEKIEAVKLQYNVAFSMNPARFRQIADATGLKELELVAAQCGEIQATRLDVPAQELFKELGRLGNVMALTRNKACVHERYGSYLKISAGEKMGIVVGPDIDLRMFFNSWGTVWAVEDKGRKSLQFFDVYGDAIHKVYCTETTDMTAYQQLIDTHRASAEPYWPEINTRPQPKDTTVNTAPAELRQHWLGLKDTHDFYPMLIKHNVSRITALRDVGADLSQQVSNQTAEAMLMAAAEQQIKIMCFVSNPGMVQIHSGAIQQLKRTGPWFNVLDPTFNLHLNTDCIASSWVVNKPTADGWVTSLECYNSSGELIVQFFGARKAGTPELPAWRALMESFCTTPLAA